MPLDGVECGLVVVMCGSLVERCGHVELKFCGDKEGLMWSVFARKSLVLQEGVM